MRTSWEKCFKESCKAVPGMTQIRPVTPQNGPCFQRFPGSSAFKRRSKRKVTSQIFGICSAKPHSSSRIPLSTMNILWRLWCLLGRRRAAKLDSHLWGPHTTLRYLSRMHRCHRRSVGNGCRHWWTCWPQTVVAECVGSLLLLLLYRKTANCR